MKGELLHLTRTSLTLAVFRTTETPTKRLREDLQSISFDCDNPFDEDAVSIARKKRRFGNVKLTVNKEATARVRSGLPVTTAAAQESTVGMGDPRPIIPE